MKRIEKIRFVRETDFYPDLSWIGTFDSEAKSELAIRHHNGNANQLPWFNPQPGACTTHKQARKVYERMMAYERGEWEEQGIKAEAEIHTSADGRNWTINKITSGGLCGIASDSDEVYIREVETEQMEELINVLKEFGFTREEIEAAQQKD